ncbi:MAG TPA: hypothetical protein VF977_10175 [Candidatus Binatia bacterium]
MSQRSDALTVALTGQLSFILIVSTILALIASYLILRLYRRAVVRSMRRRSRSEILEPKGYLPREPEHKPNEAPLNFSFVARNAAQANPDAAPLYRKAKRRRWLIAAVHTIAGCCFAAAMTAAFLSAGKMAFSPFRFMFLTWANAWPVVVAIDLVVGLSRRARLMIVLPLYFLIGSVVGAIALAKSPALSVGQLLYLWLDLNAPPTVLLLIFLNRRIRALGPLVLVFMILGVTGASFVVTLIGNNFKLLRTVSNFSYSIGLGARGTMVGLHMIGFAAFAILGWILLGSLRRLYEKKYISQQSITVDAMWLLFGIVNSIGLVFEGRLWILSGLAAFVLYKLVGAALFRVLGVARQAKSRGPRLLLLRVFALGKRSEGLYDSLGKSWRTVGSMQMIAGPDLATSTIEPHEFLDFVSGKLDRRFIDTGGTLDLRIDQMDLAPDGDGLFRVTEFFCHDDTWKLTLARLADESDAVLMDLRGFSQLNSGCVFEIHELVNVVPLQRVVFAVDESTDQSFVRATMQQAWRQIKERSPNRRIGAGQVSLVELSGDGAKRDLLYALCAAASTAVRGKA